MDHPPFVIFSQHCSPASVLDFLATILPEFESTGTGDTWSEASGTWNSAAPVSPLVLKVKHDPDYYAGKDFPMQRSGLANYLQNFEGAEDRPDLFSYIRGLSFALSISCMPDPLEEGDPRPEVVLAVAKAVDGIIFLPWAVLDAEGRAIVTEDGPPDADATVPSHEASQASADSVLSVASGESGEREGAEGEENDSDDDDEDEDACDPPDAGRTAKRFQVLCAGFARGFIESETESSREERNGTAGAIIGSLRASGAWDEAEADEKRLIETPAGELRDEDLWKLTWQCEAAAVLAWALGLAELPSYDVQADPQSIYSASGLADGPAEALRMVESARLRDPEELGRMERGIFALHWRVRQFSIKREAIDFEAFAKTAWFGPLDLSLARLMGGDLAIGNHSIAESDEEEWRPAGGVLHERHKAINWLTGETMLYSDTDTAT